MHINRTDLFWQERFTFLLYVRFNKKNGIAHWIKAVAAVNHLYSLDVVECSNEKKVDFENAFEYISNIR